ncbi:MAG TPA: amino acid adenylation domain-containing protein, partial [Vicinamibacteria bacterium]|nr:amino acid adenylation domain-containing protein [Vicinamibacteria bacterium]
MADVLVFPTAFSQRLPWFQDQLDPGRALYNVPFAVRLDGALDAAALKAALQTIVDRHEVLRTTFGVEDGTPVQVIAPRPSLELPFVDLSLRADPQREADAMAADEATRTFDLARGPLLRSTLLRLGEARHVLLLTAHHGVFDGWSAGVFFHELAAAYAARVAPGSAPSLPELPLQYADYAVWQREWLEGTAAATQLAYWRERLRGAPEFLDLPADRPRPPSQSHRGATHVFDLPPSLVGALRELSRGEGATLFMTLLAAFKALLGRLAGQDEVVVGTPVANRGRLELEGLIGSFVNAVVLRTDLAGDPPFRELLARVRQTALAAYAHQELPIEKVIEELRPQRSLAFSPLFQVMFTLQQDITRPEELPGLALSLVEVPSGTAKLDLTVFLKERGQGLQGVVEYATDLFDPPSVARRMAQYRTLLEAVAARPDTRLSRLPLLTETERREVLVDWNRTELVLPEDAWVHEQVAAQARRTPEAVAVAAGRESRSYDELDRRADAVARCLQDSGVGPESLVGLFLERSPDLLVALLGVLKSGGAYLPLDPSFPAERLAHMLSDSGARTVLVSRALRGAVPPSKAAAIVVEDATENGEGRPTPVALQAESLAYVLYTSGSTGRPKGVAVSHGALLNLLESVRREPGIRPEDTLCAVTTLSFDIAALEVFLPLLVGGRVVLADRETAMDGRALAALLEASGSTLMQATPATWRLLLDAGWPGSPRLTALCGGEALPRELAEALIPRVAALWNMYGPTETTVWSTCQRVESGSGPISIGRPFANTEAYVLDRHLEPAPMGVRGELYLGGAGVARGYLGQPELTAERFVPDPFAVRPGARLYWTGDLARRRGDGTLEVLGRLDHQVKIRGFRIELEEVETALLRHPAVARAVVATHDERTVERALVAWIVPEQGSEASPRELREFLRGVLPEYMVPSLFVTLQALPLTPNGKIDRRALPAPGADAGIETIAGNAYVAPQTPVEEALAAVWCSVLGREAVGIHDNFFELGGHSLLAARLIARTRERLGVELSLRSLFHAPTVAGLAAAIGVGIGREVVALAPAIPRISRGGDLPLSRGQERLWFLQRMAPERAVYNVPLALRLRGPVNVPALDRAVAAIGTRHEVLRMAFPSRDGRPVAVVRDALRLEHDDLSSLAEPQREDAAVCLVQYEARRPFDLEHGPLCRVRLARLTAEDHLLVLNLHHIVCDLWSLGLLLRELSAAYATGVGGGTPALPEPMVQYADYAAWQRGLDETGPDAALDVCVRRLEGMPVLELPTDRPRPAVQTFAGATVSRQLPLRLAGPIEALAASEGATLFITLLAAF